MKRKIRSEEVYCSMVEFERKYFPISHKKKVEEEKIKKPSTFGTGLAVELLENIRREIAK